MRTLAALAALTVLAGCAGDVALRRTRLSSVDSRSPLVRFYNGMDPGPVELDRPMRVVFWENLGKEPATAIVRGIESDPTLAPGTTGFSYDPERQLAVAGPLPEGGIASLVMPTAGTYRYELYVAGSKTNEGQIIVAGGER